MGKEINKKYVKLIPCPDYDIEGMESWLSDMAASGLMLRKNGFFAGFAFFEKCVPCKVRYRLQVTSEKKSFLSDDNGEPNDELIEITRHYGWEYVAKRGKFHIYRTRDSEARELNTDPEVQAMAIKEVQRRERRGAISSVISTLIVLLINFKGCILLTTLAIGSYLSLFGIMLLLWSFINLIIGAIHMGRLRKKLITYGTLDHNKPWKGKTRIYHMSRVLLPILTIVWLGMLLCEVIDYDKGIRKISLYSYEGQVPFATMKDFAPGGTYSMSDYGELTNYIRQGQDWLAPDMVEWKETASITFPDGSRVSGMWMVDYYETAAPWLARQVARESFIRDKLRGHFDKEKLQFPEIEADYAVLYSSIGIPTVIIQRDRVVVCARFTFFSGQRMPEERWVRILADSIK